jgi:type IV pilus assembly protein PilV
MPRPQKPTVRRQGGFSLIEVLVAVLIVSVGILGVAGLQLVALQNNTSAMFRTQAFQLGYDIIDRARANPGETYDVALADDAPVANDCTAGTCTTAQMRDWDVASWLGDVAAALPNGDGSIVTNAGTTTVTIQWVDDRGGQPLDVSVTTTL